MRLLITVLAAACAAAAWGEIWLGPTAGWTRASGSTGYAETDGKDIGRSATFWGAAAGYSKGPFYVEGGFSFPPGASDEGPLLSGWRGEWKETSYRELNSHLAGGWRLGEGDLRPTVGLSAYWGHATYEGKDLSPWTLRGDPTIAVYGRAVNDLFVGPSAGVELWTEPVSWRLLVAVGYDTHHESGGAWRKYYYQSGHRRKVFHEHNLAYDFVAGAAALQLTWYSWGPVRVDTRLGIRGDLYQLGGDFDLKGVSGARMDVTFGVAPALVF